MYIDPNRDDLDDGTRRLIVLSHFLRNFKAESVHLVDKTPIFDLTIWHYFHYDTDDYHCGTAACALGWACMLPEFKAEGLRFYDCRSNTIPMFRYHIGYIAAMYFFNISNKQSTYLFDPGAYDSDDNNEPKELITPDDVADRIDELVDLRINAPANVHA